MEDDFNTADAIAAIFELVKFSNTQTKENSTRLFAERLYDVLQTLTEILGFSLEAKEEILDQEIEDLIAQRQAARKEKNFQKADQIRDTLLEKGILLEDTREGVKWKRV